MTHTPHTPRRLGIRGATTLGIGAIIGGAPIVLAGAAFTTAGAGALLAVLANGALAALGAVALSELGARFPRSGGIYLFAQRIVGIESAFAVGWLVLFGAVSAAAVFAIGFASFATPLTLTLLGHYGVSPPAPLEAALPTLFALAATTLAGARATRPTPHLLTFAKLAGMTGLGLSGLLLLALEPAALEGVLWGVSAPWVGTSGASWLGVVQAMGLLFIAYQGFVVLSASAGELHHPARTLPRASIATIAIATALYLPIFLASASLGRPEGATLLEFAASSDTQMVAFAAEKTLGSLGYALVALTALIAMLTALDANLSAAVKLVRTMARDGTLPRRLGRSDRGGLARRASLSGALAVSLVVLLLPDVRSAGIATGVAFLLLLTVAPLLALLLRRREGASRLPYRAPGGRATLLLAALTAAAVALINAVSVPAAGVSLLSWTLLGALVYIAALRSQARTLDAELEANDPDVVALRGRRPLVLTPIANPASAAALLSVAEALAPPDVGRVTLLHVINPQAPDEGASETLLRATLRAARDRSSRPQLLSTLAEDPWSEMERVAQSVDGESLLLGLSNLDDEATLARLDALFGRLRADVVVLRAPQGWTLEGCRRVVVPFGGRADQERVRARILGSLARLANPEVEIVRVVAAGTSARELRRYQRQLERLVEGRELGQVRCSVEASDDAISAMATRTADADLLLLGLPKRDASRHAFGPFASALLARTPERCAVILVHARL